MTTSLAPEHFGTHPFARQPVFLSEAAWSSRSGANPDFRRVLAAAVDILCQGEDLLAALPAETYATTLPVVFNGSIGGHYRHCLDHFTSLLRGMDAGEVDYDHRERDHRIERDPGFALGLTRQIRTTLGQLDAGALAAPVSTRCEVSYARGDSPVTRSSVGRELAYAIAHAIVWHHRAVSRISALHSNWGSKYRFEASATGHDGSRLKATWIRWPQGPDAPTG